MTALSLILIGGWFRLPGEILLWIAGVLTFITGYQYYEKGMDYVRKEAREKTKPAAVKKAETPKTAAKTPAVRSAAKKTGVKKSPAKKAAKAKKPAAKAKNKK